MTSLPRNPDSDAQALGEDGCIFPGFVGAFNAWPHLSTLGSGIRIERAEQSRDHCRFRGVPKLQNFKGSGTDKLS